MINLFDYNVESTFVELSIEELSDSPSPYIYKLTHKSSGKIYIGCRYANKRPADKDLGLFYFTSSKAIKDHYIKHPKAYSAEFICFDSNEAAIEAEHLLVNKIKETHGDDFSTMFYNTMVSQHKTHNLDQAMKQIEINNSCPDITRRRIENMRTPESRAKRSLLGKNAWKYATDDVRESRTNHLKGISQKGVLARRHKKDEELLDAMEEQIMFDNNTEDRGVAL